MNVVLCRRSNRPASIRSILNRHSFIVNLWLAALALGLSGTALQAGPLDQWTLQQPPIVQGDLTHVAFLEGQFLAFAEFGQVLTSTHGTNWLITPSGVQNALRDVASGNGRFVAVGGYGPGDAIPVAEISVSTNGVTWDGRRHNTMPPLLNIVFGAGSFFTFATQGTNSFIWSSPDGFEWTKRTVPGAVYLSSLSYTAGRFLATGGYSIGLFPHQEDHQQAFTSVDGVEWQQFISEPGHAFGPGLTGPDRIVFLASPSQTGNVFRPLPDGAWSRETSGLAAAGMTAVDAGVFTGREYTLFADNPGANLELMTHSADGLTWAPAVPLTGLPLDETRPRLSSFAYGNGTWVGVGPSGLIATSPNAVDWSLGERATTLPLQALCEGNGLLVAVGGTTNTLAQKPGIGVVLTSSDGHSWARPSVTPNAALFSVTQDRGQFVAVGGAEYVPVGEAFLRGLGVVWTSPDGTNWSQAPFDPSVPLMKVVSGNGMFVAIGQNWAWPDFSTLQSVLASSTDGVHWTHRIVADHQLYRDLAFGAGRFVLSMMGAAHFPVIYSSTNLVQWDGPFPRAGTIGSGLAFANGLFRVTGSGGNDLSGVYTSPNGVDWTLVSTTRPQPDPVVGGADRFIGLRDGTVLMTSRDGVNWDEHSLPSNDPMATAGFGQRRVYAIGDRGTILASGILGPAFVGSPLLQANGLQLTLEDDLGAVMTLETSNDLRRWSAVETKTNQFGQVQFSIPGPARPAPQFFRASAAK